MRNLGFSFRLAAQSIRKNRKFYAPYLLTCVLTAAMFYIMLYLSGESRRAMKQVSLPVLLSFGAAIIAIFSAILLFYTNSFLMKQRRRELGLYNILGMEKRHIGRIMFWETLDCAAIGILGGVAAGILLSKLLLLVLYRLLRGTVPFGFWINWAGIVTTAIVFAVIFGLNLVCNLIRVGKTRPVELMRSGSMGERQPKTRWILTLLGLAALGGGYAIAITVESPLKAISLFFVAVLLVIVGTYLLFIAGSTAFLKLLRKNRRFYYKARHFVAVSGMLHRMKRNAAGLASICILCTMVLVTVSTTFCLYVGTEDIIARNYPHDVTLKAAEPVGDLEGELEQLVRNAAQKTQTQPAWQHTSLLLEFNCLRRASTLQLEPFDGKADLLTGITVLRAEDYIALTGKPLLLADGFAMVYEGEDCPEPARLRGSVTVEGVPVEISGVLDTLPMDCAGVEPDGLLLVVNENDFIRIHLALQETDQAQEWLSVRMQLSMDFDAPEEQQRAFAEQLNAELADTVLPEDCGFDWCAVMSRASAAEDFYLNYGGFFFLGLFLGTLFLMATVLMIYYKQISEGYEDAGRFEIMRKVGMSDQEVRASIRSQILTVFFLPLVTAGIHICAAFPMIRRLLQLFMLYNTGLFALCCLGTFLVFAAIYGLIYAVTAKAYYQIVRS